MVQTMATSCYKVGESCANGFPGEPCTKGFPASHDVEAVPTTPTFLR